MSWQSKMYGLGNNLFDLDEIAMIASQYPSDPQTNPIGTYGVGVQSDAKHQAASARASDMFYDLLKWNPIIPKAVRGPIADTLSFAGGVGVEGVGSLFDYVKSGFKDKNYLTAAKEDIVSDWKGTFGTDYGTSTANIMNNVYKENNYAPKINSNIFNQGTIEAEDYTTKQNRVLAEQAEQQRLAKIAEQQRLAKVAEQQKIDFQQRINPVANVPQSEYQTKMDDVYKNVVVDNSGNRGYTGTGTQSRAGIRNTPAYRGQQAAAAVDRKAKSMGVASPVRRTPGTKYGFGL